MTSAVRKGSVAFALLTTFDGIDPLAAVVVEMHFLLSGSSLILDDEEGDKGIDWKYDSRMRCLNSFH